MLLDIIVSPKKRDAVRCLCIDHQRNGMLLDIIVSPKKRDAVRYLCIDPQRKKNRYKKKSNFNKILVA